MCFKMNTLQGSMTVLGNKKALSLPDVKGRGIWATGNKFVEVQAPFLSEDELEGELSALVSEFKTKYKTFHGPMVSLKEVKPDQDINIIDTPDEEESGEDLSPE